MDDLIQEGARPAAQPNPVSAFEFHGQWQEFMPIAVTNLLLTIVTLGFYRFWGTTRERQYLWSKSQFIDERLEWTGTGKELFVGFIVVAAAILFPFFLLNFFAQGLILRGEVGLALLLFFVMFGGIFYFTGLARFRALRYRLGRTYWRGIRGGSHDQGFSYGWSYVWKTIVGYIVFGLMVPWSMMELWNERWNKMSFGPHRIQSTGSYQDTFARYLLFYLAPILSIILAGVIAGLGAVLSAATDSPAAAVVNAVLAVFVFYGVLGLVALIYYAKFFRVAVDGLSLHNLDFSFRARTKDWVLLFLGHAGIWMLAAIPFLIIMTIYLTTLGGDIIQDIPGVGPQLTTSAMITVMAATVVPFMLVGPFIRYRNWRFFMTYMEAYGEIDLDELTQSETERSKHGEGLLDAFDVGAI